MNEKTERVPTDAETIENKAAESERKEPEYTEAPAEEAAAAESEPPEPEAKAAEAAKEAAPEAEPPAEPTAEPPAKEKHGKGKRRRKKRARVIALVLLAYLVVLAAAAALLDARHAVVELNGPEQMRVEFGETFIDPGARAWSEGRIFGRSKRAIALSADRSVDTGALGDTVLRYSATVLGKTVTAERTVRVSDTTPPVITLEESEEPTNWFTGFVEPGFTAEDRVDGDLTDRVQRVELDDRVVYSVADSSGNLAVVERPIRFSVSTPGIYLVGGSDVTIPAAMSYVDPGYEARDSLGNDLTEYVTVSGEITPWRAGVYTLSYRIENEQGDAAVARRRITVEPVPAPQTEMPDQPTIYLTFDDGPGPYTAQLLDVLARYGVKATFFVTDQFEGYEDMIGRAYREGHSIGVHSLTHEWDIYDSEAAYFRDFMAMEEIIFEQTGSYTKLFRFPGGSSNTVSRTNKGIMTRLAQCMTDMGYVYFDWNVSSGDAGGTVYTSEVIDNVVAGCSEHPVSVVLQHDIKDFSVAAVEQIILWGQRNGYVFAPLDETSYPARHGINN